MGFLVTFNYSLLLVTQLAGIRYLVFVTGTLLVTGLSALQRCSAAVVGPIPGTLQANCFYSPHSTSRSSQTYCLEYHEYVNTE